MNERSKIFVGSHFREYYRNAKLAMPQDLIKREWGFIFFNRSYPKVTMQRHINFSSEKDLRAFLTRGQGMTAAAHVYHSTALYSYPGARTMNEKEWLGADLIFDLDADHLRGVVESYSGMLEMVKSETMKLIDFLFDDFGFDTGEMEVVFSGGRGYHIHISDPRVRTLESNERREIIDYMRGTGLDYDRFLIEESVKGETGEKNRRTRSLRILSDSGWAKKVHDSLIELLESISKLDDKEAFEELARRGIIDRKMGRKLINLSRKELKEDVRKGFVGFKGFPRTFWESIIDIMKLEIGGESDEPVTSDIKRLIRLPTSLHGGSSLLVKPIEIDEMEEFNPLIDAVVFGEDPVEVEVTAACDVSIKDINESYEEGRVELPEYAAIFIICRGIGEIV
ncbi:MAG: DNA primase catalytic subunit PriS [Halobacteriota archaeon]|nr:DNA primase catalytic subunit PriS [Halobacteriota archaeon]